MNGILRRNQKAVSPVIATIIIVAVAIVMSIAVAYWMLGLATTFTRYEKLEFISAYAVKDAGANGFIVTVTVKSTGTSPATVTKFFFNGVPDKSIESITIEYESEAESGSFIPDETTVTINSGNSATFSITIPWATEIGSGKAVSGVTLEITIQTAAGNQYPKTIVLP